jgi:hypothetical protein
MNSDNPRSEAREEKSHKVPWTSGAFSNFSETFGLSRLGAFLALLFFTGVTVAGVFWFIHTAVPGNLIITSGPPGSSFQRMAEQYRAILSSNGVKVTVLESHGSMENLERLGDRKFRVDIGLVQTGEKQGESAEKLYSLGSVAYQPLFIFYRSPAPVVLLSGFTGKRLAVGAAGSGTRALALMLLETNGIVPSGSTPLLDMEPEVAARALLDDQVDAVFLMGDSASSQTMRMMLRSPGVQIYDYVEADAYVRRFTFLNRLILPRGAIDLGKDVPSHDVNLVGPTVELIVRSGLHPALTDLLLEAAREVNGKATLLQRQGEFPSPLEHEIQISPEAIRYYKSGKSFLYRSLPFWLASLLNRILVAIVPVVLLLVPGLRFIPVVYKWRIQLGIYRWYRSLLRLERDLYRESVPGKRDELKRRLDHIEKSVNQLKVPASFAGQFYGLREHIGFVREKLEETFGG